MDIAEKGAKRMVTVQVEEVAGEVHQVVVVARFRDQNCAVRELTCSTTATWPLDFGDITDPWRGIDRESAGGRAAQVPALPGVRSEPFPCSRARERARAHTRCSSPSRRRAAVRRRWVELRRRVAGVVEEIGAAVRRNSSLER